MRLGPKHFKPRLAGNNGLKNSSRWLLSLLLSIFALLLSGAEGVVVNQVRAIAGESGRTDYALAGESLELTCHYMMKDELEDIKQLVWSKDGKNFLRWMKNKNGLQVLDYTFKGHIDINSTHSHLSIRNATIEMHGKYKCSVKTDLGKHEMEQDLIVISQTNCKLNDWRVSSEPNKCVELFRFDCRNMFPKPEPSCGLWNGKSDKFIRSVIVDISEEPNNKTYRVKYNDRFQLDKQQADKQKVRAKASNKNADLLQFAGHLVFKCDISVPETSWKLSMSHKMFDYNDGCNQDPLETIERIRHNYSSYAALRLRQQQQHDELNAAGDIKYNLNDFEMLTSELKYQLRAGAGAEKVELNCWQKPKIGTIAQLSCATGNSNHVKLVGVDKLQCSERGWIPFQEPTSPRLGRKVDLSFKQAKEELSSAAELNVSSSSNQNDLEEGESTTPRTSELEFIPEHDNNNNNNNLPQSSQTWPAAPLLPSCVSTRRYYQPISNTMPLLDDNVDLKRSRNHHRKLSPSWNINSMGRKNPSSGTEVRRNPLQAVLIALCLSILLITTTLLKESFALIKSRSA